MHSWYKKKTDMLLALCYLDFHERQKHEMSVLQFFVVCVVAINFLKRNKIITDGTDVTLMCPFSDQRCPFSDQRQGLGGSTDPAGK